VGNDAAGELQDVTPGDRQVPGGSGYPGLGRQCFERQEVEHKKVQFEVASVLRNYSDQIRSAWGLSPIYIYTVCKIL